MTKHSKNKKKYFLCSAAGVISLAVLVVISVYASLRFGSANMNTAEFFGGLLGKSGFETQSLIIQSVRLPRVAAGMLAGIGLSVSGILLQSVTDNGLASPNIIGVNSGAGFAVTLVLSFFPFSSFFIPIAAFTGALICATVIITLSNKLGGAKASIILAGIALTTLLNAAISALNLADSDVLNSYNAFSIGSIAGVRLQSLTMPAIIITLSFSASLLFSRKINTLALGDSVAASLGTNVKPLRSICIVCASASAAAAVSFAGLLGFVGLVVPHIARKFFGNDIRVLLPAGAVIGACLVITADLIGRLIAAPSEIPVGIMMAFVGAPFFIGLLIKARAKI